MFTIEDTNHAEYSGEFTNLEEAIAELNRRAKLPWDKPPNVAPCTSWKTCGRAYEVVEYDVAQIPWKELNRVFVFEVSVSGIRWAKEFRK